MQTGTLISGIGHVVLIGWAVVGGAISPPRQTEKMQVTEVSVISGADFAAMVSDAPRAETRVRAPLAPQNRADAPKAPVAGDRPRLNTIGAPKTPEAPGQRPDLSNVSERPVTIAQISTPDLAAPGATDELGVTLIAPAGPIAARDQSGLRAPDRLEIAPPMEQPAPRVDTTPAPVPPTDAERADLARHATREDADATTRAPRQTETAPDQASTEIVTEAKAQQETRAPARSSRPRGRPARLADKTLTARAIEEALARAQAEAGGTQAAGSTTSGPPLTEGEKDGLRLAVQKCWNVGSLSSDALRVIVTLGLSLGRDGRIRPGTVHMISATEGSVAATRQAYEAARRAIMRCGAKGFDLPTEKYDHWRDIEIVFNPEKMRIK